MQLLIGGLVAAVLFLMTRGRSAAAPAAPDPTPNMLLSLLSAISNGVGARVPAPAGYGGGTDYTAPPPPPPTPTRTYEALPINTAAFAAPVHAAPHVVPTPYVPPQLIDTTNRFVPDSIHVISAAARPPAPAAAPAPALYIDPAAFTGSFNFAPVSAPAPAAAAPARYQAIPVDLGAFANTPTPPGGGGFDAIPFNFPAGF